MAVLNDADRNEVSAEWMRVNKEKSAVTKPPLRLAIDGLDDYANDNAAAINAAVPQPARGEMSASQKAQLFSLTVLKRYIKEA